ncbi:g9931 [Coccomyxa elongata]
MLTRTSLTWSVSVERMWRGMVCSILFSTYFSGARAVSDSAISGDRRATAQVLESGSAGAGRGGLSFNSAKYPFVYRDETIKDTLFGVEVPDPYRWLEDGNSSATKAFVDAQNDLFREFMRPYIPPVYTFLSVAYNLVATPLVCPPVVPANQSHVIFQGNDQNFYVLADKDQSYDSAKLVFDSSLLDNSGKYVIAEATPNADQTYLAVSLATNESDWHKLRVVEIDSKLKGHLLKDVLENTKSNNPVWSPDGKGFFYTNYVPENPSSLERESNQTVVTYQQVWYHVVGTNQSQDMCLLSFPGNPTWIAEIDYTDDNKYIVISVARNEAFNKLWIMKSSDLPVSNITGAVDLSMFNRTCGNTSALPILKLVDNFDALYDVLFTDDDIFTIATSANSTQIRIVRTNITEMLPPGEWPTFLPAVDQHVIQCAFPLADDTFVLSSLHNMATVMELRSKSNGTLLDTIPLPASLSSGGYISSLCPGDGDSDFYYIVSSTTDPGSIYQFDPANAGRTVLPVYSPGIPGGYDTSDIVTRLVFVTSKDGTVQIPLLITSRKNMTLDGNNPTLLHGYGGQNIIEKQAYNAPILAWILGYNGVYAFAAVRGGGELGLDWWNGGHGMKKQNTFDDFVSCAQYLIRMNVTSPAKLGIQGSSNGGLLMAAVLTQHPGLWSAAIVEAGSYDMLRSPSFASGYYFVREYGDPQHNETEFRNLLSYSPLHNVRLPNGTHQYPATLLTVGDSDDRVVPFHSYKFISTLQHTLAQHPGSQQSNPILMYVQKHVGHHEFGKEVTMVFIAQALNALWTQPLSSLQASKIQEAAGRKKLGVAAWVGIAIACFVAFALLVTLAAYLILKAKKKKGILLPVKS